jgi:hypothetical protein
MTSTVFNVVKRRIFYPNDTSPVAGVIDWNTATNTDIKLHCCSSQSDMPTAANTVYTKTQISAITNTGIHDTSGGYVPSNTNQPLADTNGTATMRFMRSTPGGATITTIGDQGSVVFTGLTPNFLDPVTASGSGNGVLQFRATDAVNTDASGSIPMIWIETTVFPLTGNPTITITFAAGGIFTQA